MCTGFDRKITDSITTKKKKKPIWSVDQRCSEGERGEQLEGYCRTLPGRCEEPEQSRKSGATGEAAGKILWGLCHSRAPSLANGGEEKY